jgi:hypothetical protein
MLKNVPLSGQTTDRIVRTVSARAHLTKKTESCMIRRDGSSENQERSTKHLYGWMIFSAMAKRKIRINFPFTPIQFDT